MFCLSSTLRTTLTSPMTGLSLPGAMEVKSGSTTTAASRLLTCPRSRALRSMAVSMTHRGLLLLPMTTTLSSNGPRTLTMLQEILGTSRRRSLKARDGTNTATACQESSRPTTSSWLRLTLSRLELPKPRLETNSRTPPPASQLEEISWSARSHSSPTTTWHLS